MRPSRQYGDPISKRCFATSFPYSKTYSSYILTSNTNPLFYTSSIQITAKDILHRTFNEFQYEFNPESLLSTSAVTKGLSNLAYTACSSIKKGKQQKMKENCIKSSRNHPIHNEYSEVEPNIRIIENNVRRKAASSHRRNDSVKSLTPLRKLINFK